MLKHCAHCPLSMSSCSALETDRSSTYTFFIWRAQQEDLPKRQTPRIAELLHPLPSTVQACQVQTPNNDSRWARQGYVYFHVSCGSAGNSATGILGNDAGASTSRSNTSTWFAVPLLASSISAVAVPRTAEQWRAQNDSKTSRATSFHDVEARRNTADYGSMS